MTHGASWGSLAALAGKAMAAPEDAAHWVPVGLIRSPPTVISSRGACCRPKTVSAPRRHRRP
jgi:hypothetical protein